MGVTTQGEFSLSQRLDGNGNRPCIMHYLKENKDGCPGAKDGSCRWSHTTNFSPAEKNTMGVIAAKRKKQEELNAAERAKGGKSGKKGGKPQRSNSKGRKGGGKSESRKSNEPCRSWESTGTCIFGDACRFVHVAK